MSEALQKILVVDDDSDVISMMTAVLRTSYTVLSAPDGQSAVKLLEQHDFAGIIADQMMPGMTGVELLDRSHARTPAAARILITASDHVHVLEEAVNRARVHRFVSKPLRLADLPGLVADAIRESRLEAENARLATELARKNEELNRINERLEADVRLRTQELQAAVRKLEELALRDGLTGLYNHRFLQEALDAELARAKRHSHALGLLFIDVDHFKIYNDRNGHPAGDRLLASIADVLTGGRKSGLGLQARASDIAARYGGEEFVLILPETGLDGAIVKAERVRRTVAEYAFEHAEAQPDGCVSVSIGVAAFPAHAADKQQLIDAADREMYRAKRAGRNRVCAVGR